MFVKFFVLPATPLPPSCFRDGYSRCWSHSHPFSSKTSTSEVWRTLSLFRACFIFRKLEPGEYRIFCSHFGTFCQTVVKSCSCQFLVTWFMGKRLVLNEGSVAKHNDAFLVWLFVFQLILRDKYSDGSRPSDRWGRGRSSRPWDKGGTGPVLKKSCFRPFGLHYGLK